MYDDEATPASRNDSEPRNEVQIFQTISTTELLDLNDDCLGEIIQHLDVIDLCSVTRVCKQFRQLAELYFKRKFSEFDFSTVFAGRLISNEEASKVLRSFGHMIVSVTVSREVFHNHDTVGHAEEGLLKDIVECCGKNVHTLTLRNFHFTSDAVDALNMLFKSLQSLSLVGCVVAVGCVFYLSNFSSLTSLKISKTRDCSYALMDVFPALQHFLLKDVSIPSNIVVILQHFIVTHKQLELLEITQCGRISSNILRSIGKYLENVTYLRFHGSLIEGSEPNEQIQNNILHLAKLKNLQRFVWNCKFLSIGNLLAKIVSNKITLKFLSFGLGLVDDETIKAIKKMKDLENLCFKGTDRLENHHLVEIAKEMPQLKEIHLWWQRNISFDILKEVLRHTKQLHHLWICSEKYRFDRTLYNDILNIVKQRQNGIKLTITVDCTDVEDLIPQQTILVNKNWLMIQTVRNFFDKSKRPSTIPVLVV